MINHENLEIVQAIRKRRSVRTYEPVPLSREDRAYIESLMQSVSNPFGEEVQLFLTEHNISAKGEKLGTYGIVRGASTFLGVSAPLTKTSPLAVGYQVEALILGAAARGIGSVWLGGTFKRPQFARALGLDADAWFPAVVALGYEAKRRSTAEKMMRRLAHADDRELWRDIFTEDTFQVQLSEERAGAYALPLEMLRLAPSAVNGQPWRVVKRDNVFYFYETHKASLGDAETRMKQIDLGIGIAHFHLTAQALGLKGRFVRQPLPYDIRIPEDTFYHISWEAQD